MANKVYGIDLGTTYSCIAEIDEFGKVSIIPNMEGDNTTPSVVFFEGPDQIVVGEIARETALLEPGRVAEAVKRSMGSSDIVIEVDDKSYDPKEVSALILRKIVEDAERERGEAIKDVVITCPAYFDTVQRTATEQAGKLAKLSVRTVIPEPTAAAIAYGFDQEDDQVLMVYDLGGGTFDVTLIEIKGGSISVICVGGNHELGGKNWDERIVEHFAQCFEEEVGTSADELLEDLETKQELFQAAERAKRHLTTKDVSRSKITHKGDYIQVSLSREKFESLTEDLLDLTITLSRDMLERAAEKGFHSIDKILLVGGSTYMPQVTDRLTAEFALPIVTQEPNLIVAKGAAIYAQKIQLDDAYQERLRNLVEDAGGDAENAEIVGRFEQQAVEEVAEQFNTSISAVETMIETKVTNATPKSFGVQILDVEDDDREKCNNLIIRDAPLPMETSRRYFTASGNQSHVKISAWENNYPNGPDDGYVELDDCDEVGSAILTFERPLPMNSPIDVTFNLSPDGLLSVEATEPTTNQEIAVQFQADSLMSEEELIHARDEKIMPTKVS